MRIFHKHFPRFLSDHRGATAIEYGLIAGLIAIGIVGSLVATKGSLNSVFSLTAANMGSSTSGVSPENATRFAYWSNRAVQSSSTTKSTSRITTNLTYKDGTTVYLRQDLDSNGVRTGSFGYQIDDYSTNMTTIYSVDQDGKIQTFEQVTYTKMPPSSLNQRLIVDGLYSNGALTGVRTSVYAGNSSTSSSTAPPTAAYQTDIKNADIDGQYFKSYVPLGT
jgi:pilus assembly protein Flp/PilA